jgi:hypothetical protein
MSEGLNRERWARIVAEPFVPANISGTTTLHVSAEYRLAAALARRTLDNGVVSCI